MKARTRARRGFTILEMAITCVLMLVVALVLARAWSAFGRPALLAVARARVAQEANLAAEAIARDVGQLVRPEPGAPGDDPPPSITPAGPSSVALRVDDGSGLVRTVVYETDPDDPGKLFRSVDGDRRVVANLVTGFAAAAAMRRAPGDDRDVPGVELALTLGHRAYDREPDGTIRTELTRRYLLFVEVEQP